jgi:hypothetical protein
MREHRMQDGLVVRVSKEAEPILAGIEPGSIPVQVHALIRQHHDVPERIDHEGDPVESATVHAARRIRGGIRLEIGYSRDRHPSSRYDKSMSANGWLTVSSDGRALLRGSLGRLRTWLDHNRL